MPEQTTKVVFVQEESNAHASRIDALKAAGFEVTWCSGGFDALDELGSQGADILIASTSLTDLSGYQLSCLIKSNDRTTRLPIILMRGKVSEHDEFWRTASLADIVLDDSQLEDIGRLVATIEKMVARAREVG